MLFHLVFLCFVSWQNLPRENVILDVPEQEDEHDEDGRVLDPSPLHHLPESGLVSDFLLRVINVHYNLERVFGARSSFP